MPRPKKLRYIEFPPGVRYFKPRGIPLSELEEVVLTAEELEALKLKELEGLSQKECAKRMGISRTTFRRDLESAHFKITEALLKNKAIRIEGGTFKIKGRTNN